MRYLLDTNVVIGLLNGTAPQAARGLRQKRPGDVAVSAVVLHELYFGAYRSVRVERNLVVVDALRFVVLDFDRDDARHAGEVRALLAKVRTPIGPYDVLIAGQARARGLILLTGNLAEFTRVPGLRAEHWDAA